MRLIFLKQISSPVKLGGGGSKSGEGFFFLMKIVGAVLPHRLSFWDHSVSYVGIYVGLAQ
jgi:hypothetical protein